jgi:exopolysaccharide biosynthesis polyprenyl glycosylphosphotransferase
LGFLGLYRCYDRVPNLFRLWLGIVGAFLLLLPLHFGWDEFPHFDRIAFVTALVLALVILPGLRILISFTVQGLRGLGVGRVPAYLVCSAKRQPLLAQWLTDEGRSLVGYELVLGNEWSDLVTKVAQSGAKEVILDNWPSQGVLLLIWQKLCAKGVRLRCLQGDGSLWSYGVIPQFFQGRPILEFEPPALFQFRFGLKRALDIVASGLGLVLLAPLFLLIAIWIKTTSEGPVFFMQERVGVRGKLFQVYKFRSMYLDAEQRRAELLDANEGCGPLFKIRNDPRITPAGRWLRRFSLDELPQLINVFRGEMSLVGPRPALPSEVAEYSPWQRQRLLVLPGISGLWQVSGRSDIRDFEDAVSCDLYYIQHWSFKLDLEILWRTLAVVLLGKGAY